MKNNTTIATSPRAPRTRCLRHPLTNLPSIATEREYWVDRATGRNIGLVLLFADGHTASLTYAEIHALERNASELANE